MRGELIILLMFAIAIANAQITGEVITGKAVSQQTNLSITVDTESPVITISSPINKTYNTDYISFNYSATDSVSSISRVWYSLDFSDNITLTGNTFLNVGQGNHILIVYANDSVNYVNFSSVSFSVNLSLGWNITTYRYNSSTTNFTYLMYQGKNYMQNISNFTLEIGSYGKIVFSELINISRDIYLDSYTNITNNLIYIDSNQLAELNKSASLWLYNLTFSNPRILMSGELCPSNICTKESYSSGILKFNVTHFTSFSAEETPTTQQPSGGGGGGGGTASAIRTFEIDKEKIHVSLKQGETKRQVIEIKNTGNTKIKFSLLNPKLEEFVRISEKSFEIEPGQVKTIVLDIIAREDALPDLYMGKLVVKNDWQEKEIIVAIEIESKKPLFDVKIEIPKRYLLVEPGKEILAQITLFSLGKVGRVDVKIEYLIKDELNTVIIQDDETFAVETRANLIKEFQLPENLKYGLYIFYVKATYNGEVASASAWFSVGKKSFFSTQTFSLLIIVLVFIGVLFVFIELRRLGKHVRKHLKIKEDDLVKTKFIKLKGGK